MTYVMTLRATRAYVGTYEADDEWGAIDAYARSIGYENAEHASHSYGIGLPAYLRMFTIRALPDREVAGV